MKCDICKKKGFDKHELIRMTINSKNKNCCPECAKAVKGRITSIGYTRQLRKHDPGADKKVELYYRVSPEYFGNAEFVKIEYTYQNETSLQHWQNIGKLTLLANALGIPDDINGAEKMLEEHNEQAIAIFKSIEVVTKEEYMSKQQF